VTSVLVGLTGFFVLAPYSMVGGGVFALDHGGRQAPATAVGLLDGFGYIGGTLAGWGVGEILQAYHHDWKPVFNVLTALVFGSALLGVLLTVVTHLGRKEGHA
jgi:sugar phosphate permease